VPPQFWCSLVAAFALVAGACAPTTAPTPPPEEKLLVVNGGENTLSVIPIDTTRPTRKISLGALTGSPQDVAARSETALVAGGDADVLVVVDLVAERVQRVIAFPAGSRPTSVVIIGETVAYVTNAGRNVVTRVDYSSGDTASVDVGQYPRDAILTRGRLFVVNGNVERCPLGTCSLGPSWLTVVDPQANTRSAGRDSIPLPSQGNARSATLGGDGLIYVVNTGDQSSETPGRLSIVDPIRREEVGSFSGFGFVPAVAASDGGERLFLTSERDGLMEFNTRTRRVVRGAAEAIHLNDIVTAAVDSRGRIYGVEAAGCGSGQPGRLRVLRPDLTEARSLLLGVCPTAAAIVLLPGIPAVDD